MISLDEVNKTILELENKDTTFAVCERLAWLYIVKDHLSPQIQNQNESRNLSISGKSEFLETVNEKDVNSVLRIIDEHMDIMKIVYPKEYNMILGKIKTIG